MERSHQCKVPVTRAHDYALRSWFPRLVLDAVSRWRVPRAEQVCEERSVEAAFQPCGHLAACMACCETLVLGGHTACIICREEWSSFVRVYPV